MERVRVLDGQRNQNEIVYADMMENRVKKTGDVGGKKGDRVAR